MTAHSNTKKKIPLPIKEEKVTQNAKRQQSSNSKIQREKVFSTGILLMGKILYTENLSIKFSSYTNY